MKSSKHENSLVKWNPTKYLTVLSRYMLVNRATIWFVIHENFHQRSYVMKKVQFLPERTGTKCLTQYKCILYNIKCNRSQKCFFLSNEKNFAQVPNVIRKKNSVRVKCTKSFCTCRNFSTLLMILWDHEKWQRYISISFFKVIE